MKGTGFELILSFHFSVYLLYLHQDGHTALGIAEITEHEEIVNVLNKVTKTHRKESKVCESLVNFFSVAGKYKKISPAADWSSQI